MLNYYESKYPEPNNVLFKVKVSIHAHIEKELAVKKSKPYVPQQVENCKVTDLVNLKYDILLTTCAAVNSIHWPHR